MLSQVKLYTAGSCTQSARAPNREAKRATMRFPALTALLVHPTYGKILFETGYASHFITETKKFPYSIYAHTTPVQFTQSDSMKSQLAQEGIKSTDISTIICSHFHADHIAGLRDFDSSIIITSQEGYTYHAKRTGILAVTKGFIPKLLPKNIESRIKFIENTPNTQLSSAYNPFEIGHDIFGDGSVISIDLPGHARGQFGILARTKTEEYFFVADAAWSTEAYKKMQKQSILANIITDDVSDYYTTLKKIHTLNINNPLIKIIPGHCEEAFQHYR